MSDEVEEFGITADSDDAVEQTIDHSSAEDELYANAEAAKSRGSHMHAQRGDSSDEVDPRRLHRDPTLSEIRWYYRRTFASKLVDKPIDDAFKNGFEITGDNADEAETLLDQPEFDGEGDGFVGAYKMAEKKARRDGFALIFIGTRERGAAGVHETPISEDVDVQRVTHLKVLTIDDLVDTVPHEQIQDGTGLDQQQYEVRKTGIVINTDISSPDYRTPVGYVLHGPEPQFIHADRVLHYTWNPEVDGDYDGTGVRRWDDRRSTLGQYEGDSVLIPSYDIMKGISKGNWAIMQAVYRNASHVYSVKLPKGADDEDFGNAVDATRNINAKSAFVWPDTEYEFEQHESGNEMEVEQHFEVLFDQICASHEMTKSVLFGTQSGTVSGSETDIKNYFNKVERYRSNRAEDKLEEYLTQSKRMLDSRTGEDFEYEVDVEWGPLFRLDKEARIQAMQNGANALTTLIGSFALTPDEAREILTEDFVEIDLEDLTEEQLDELDRINLTRSGQGQSAMASEQEYVEGETPESGAGNQSTAAASQGGNQGGREQGQQQASSSPAGDSDEGLTARLERLAELHDSGLLTEDEFEAAKQEVLEQ